MDRDFYSVKEFAEKLNVSVQTIRRAIKNGRIMALRIGSTSNSNIRIPHSEIDRMGILNLREYIHKMITEIQGEK